jgi:ATP-binding cassette, subfamily D (ALD), peroxisomal long-chain fatty acid import protein
MACSDIDEQCYSPSLSKYHTKVLSLVGDGTWSVTRVGEESERMERGREIADLEGKLAEVEAWETRIKELEALLGVQELEDAESP